MLYNLSIDDMVRPELPPICIVIKIDLVLHSDFPNLSRGHTDFLCDNLICVPNPNLLHRVWSSPITLLSLDDPEAGLMLVPGCGPIVSTASCRRCLPYSNIFVLIVLLFSSNIQPMNPIINCNGESSLYSGIFPPAVRKQ